MTTETEYRPKNKTELLQRIRQDWNTLMTTVHALSREDLARPGPEKWSPKDHLSHLTLWEKVALFHNLQKKSFAEAVGIDKEQSRRLAKLPAEGGINEYFFEKYKGQTVDETLAELEKIHAHLVAQIETTDWGELLKPPRASIPETLLDEIVWNTYTHYLEHDRIIRQLQA